MKTLAMVAATAALPLFAEFPSVDDVTVKQTGGRVRVDYRLSAPAVVTVDFQTNRTAGGWVSVGAENFRDLSGAVNRRVEAGAQSLVWKCRREGAAFKVSDGAFRAVLKVHALNDPPQWMTLELSSGEVRYYDCSEALPGGETSPAWKTSHVLLKKIPAAATGFFMGQAQGENANYASSETRREVVFTDDFYLAVYETTKAQYDAVLPQDGFDASGGTMPKNAVSRDALRGSSSNWPADGHSFGEGSFFSVLNSRSSCVFDLPTEAQWEFACRAGTSSALYNGLDATSEALERISWNSYNAGGGPHEVGGKEPNAFGLYDMLGNVQEHCLDRYVADLGTDRAVDPKGSETGDYYVIRGGSYNYNAANNVRAARRIQISRSESPRECGFRIWAEAVAR